MGIKDRIMHALLRVCGFGSCAEVQCGCYEYTEGTLDGRKHKRVKKHLKVCKLCLRFVASYLAVRALGKTLHPESFSDEQKQKILEGLNLKA